MQLTEYLRSSTFRRRMDAVRAGGAARDSRASRRVAAESGRKFVLCEEEAEGERGGRPPAASRRPASKNNLPSPPPPLALDDAAATAAAMALGAPAPGVGSGLVVKQDTNPTLAAPSPPPHATTVDISVRLPEGVTAADLLAPSSSDEEDAAWTDVGGGGDAKTSHPAHDWRARAAERQKVWSLSHGFKHGRKLGDWKDGDEQEEGGGGEAGATIPDEDAQVQAAIAASLEPTPVKAKKEDVVQLSSGDDEVEEGKAAGAASPVVVEAVASPPPPPPAAAGVPACPAAGCGRVASAARRRRVPSALRSRRRVATNLCSRHRLATTA